MKHQGQHEALSSAAAEMLSVLKRLGPEGLERLPSDQRDSVRAALSQAHKVRTQGMYFDTFPATGPFAREHYPKQMEFMGAGLDYRVRCLMGGNRIGKTHVGAYEMTAHLTGVYPDWWEGRRFHEPVDAWAAGKALPDDARVPTPTDGWRKVGEIRRGDWLIGSDGRPTRVVDVFPQGYREIWRVTLTDGTQVDCDSEHLWYGWMRNRRNGQVGKPRAMTTRILREWLGPCETWEIPQRPVTFYDRHQTGELPVDPYLLGLLIGDGEIKRSRIALSTADPEIVEWCRMEARKWDCELVETPDKRGNAASTWRFVRPKGADLRGCKPNPLSTALRSLEVTGCRAHDKFIPEPYLHASVEDRLALLQGLMDTDGTAGKRGGLSFSTVSDRLSLDMLDLLHSLGINASRKPKTARLKGREFMSWVINVWQTDLPVFRLQRKLVRVGRTKFRRRLAIEKVERLGIARKCTCFRVAAPDHLFLADNHVVTHNTNATVKDIIQEKLFGVVKKNSNNQNEIMGTGMVPGAMIAHDTAVYRPGYPRLIESVSIRYRDSQHEFSTIGLKAYEQGRGAFEGTARHVAWCDEEPPLEVWNEMLIRTGTVDGIIYLTFTPLDGITETVEQFLTEEYRPLMMPVGNDEYTEF